MEFVIKDSQSGLYAAIGFRQLFLLPSPRRQQSSQRRMRNQFGGGRKQLTAFANAQRKARTDAQRAHSVQTTFRKSQLIPPDSTFSRRNGAVSLRESV